MSTTLQKNPFTGHDIIQISEIRIGERARKNIDDDHIMDLADSLRDHGLLHPITIDHTGTLVAGECRLRAALLLGWIYIDVSFREDLSPLQCSILELDENTKRSEMTWQDLSVSYHNLHVLLGRESGNMSLWRAKQTAERIGVTEAKLSYYLSLYPAIKNGVKEVTNCATYKGALEAWQRYQENELRKEIGKRESAKIRREVERGGGDGEGGNNGEGRVTPIYDLVCGACEEVLPDIPNETINLILTDPIWGIDVDVVGRFEATSTHFKDSPEKLSELIPGLAKQFYRVLVQDAHCYIFAGEQFLEMWKTHLKLSGFHVRATTLIWVKESGSLNDMDINFMPRYENIIFATKGVRTLTAPCNDVLEFSRPPQSQRFVSTQKPLPLLKKLITLSSSPGELVLDPMCGSGTTIASAVSLSRKAIGIDISSDILEVAQFIITSALKGDML